MSDADLEESLEKILEMTCTPAFRSEKVASHSFNSNSKAKPAGHPELVVKMNSAAEARASILSQILEPEAADRLGRIRLVKESRATEIENRLIMLARSGQLRAKVTEDQLKELLGAVAENNERGGTAGGKIVVSRRKGGWDDNDDLLDL
ncbi:MAG: hypothetical protein Q9201_000977 [Fulgogasparrea decipioides]